MKICITYSELRLHHRPKQHVGAALYSVQNTDAVHFLEPWYRDQISWNMRIVQGSSQKYLQYIIPLYFIFVTIQHA